MNKVCSRCGQEKPLSDFHKRKDRKCGVVGFCKVCAKIRGQNWRKTKQAEQYTRNYWRKNQRRITVLQAGLTVERYNELFAGQDGRCGICKRHQTEFTKHFDIDHNHKTDKIRGLLCRTCNKNLGLYENKQRDFKIEFIKLFKEYLND
jgi:hypothetical protein